MQKLLTLIGAAMLVAVPAVATAGAPVDGTTKSVVLRNINLRPGSDADARRLLARLDRAAVEACGTSPYSLPEVKRAARRSACWSEAMAQAVDRIGQPQLAAAFQRSRSL